MRDGDAKNCTFGVSHHVQGRGSALAGGAEFIVGKAIPAAMPTIAIPALSSVFLNCLPFGSPIANRLPMLEC